jgi:hypothetical protein
MGSPGLPGLPGQGTSDVSLGHRALLDTTLKTTAFRPQILASIIAATLFCCLTAWIGWKMEAVEVITGLTGAFIGFLGGISLRIIDSGTDEDKE